MPFEVSVQTTISDGSEGKFDIKKVQAGLQYSIFSHGSEGFNKKIHWSKSNVKKRNSHEFLFYFSDAIKWGIPVLLHQNKVYMRKGGMKYEQIQFIRFSLNWVEKISIFFPFKILMVWKTQKIKISNVRDFFKG